MATPTTAGDVKTGSSVQVANASGVGGAAGNLTTALKTAGFTTGKATDATGAKLDTTAVYYVATDPAAQAVAATVARSMGVGEAVAMPSPIPVTGGKLDDGVGVLVLLGKDKAGKSLTSMTTSSVAAATPSSAGTTSTTAG
ncbi:MAG: LytR C-terminal domain-containing protein [Ilumatobacteraceae bacterium]